MGASSHPLKVLLPALKNRALRDRSHPYQIPRVNTERFKKCFVNRCLFDFKQIVINNQIVVSLFIMVFVSFNVCLKPRIKTFLILLFSSATSKPGNRTFRPVSSGQPRPSFEFEQQIQPISPPLCIELFENNRKNDNKMK